MCREQSSNLSGVWLWVLVRISNASSSVDGYFFAKSFGHEIKNLYPSLVPIVLKENYDLQGLSLKNIKLKLEIIRVTLRPS